MSGDLTTPEPHHTPGYTGFVPQYRYRIGDSFGSQTHKLLVDPTIIHSEKLVLSDKSGDDHQVIRPAQNEIELVEARFKHGDAVYQHPMIPGYEGYVPRMNGTLGQNFTISATEALGEFEKSQLESREALNFLEHHQSLQDGVYQPRDTGDRLLMESQYRLPLLAVRPEAVGVLRSLPVVEPALCPPRHSRSPFFMEHTDPKKFLKLGYGGHIPFGYSKFGQGHMPMTNSTLCDFTSNYRRRQSTEWAPVSVARPDPPMLIQSTEIYYKHVGLIPNYGDHVPGAQFRFGKTYGTDTHDAKRWLRGDFTN